MEGHISELWERALRLMEAELARPSFETWLKNTRPIALHDNTFVIGVPNDFARDWLQSRYTGLIRRTLTALLERDTDVSFIVPQVTEAPGSPELASPEPRSHPRQPEGDITVFKSLNPKYTFETFVVGNSNRFAHAASLAVAEAPARAYNPLFIYGGVGLGKTHLMHAIGHYVLAQTARMRVVYASSETFTNELINSIRDDSTVEFRNKYRNVDVLLVDDIQFLAGKERTQEEFFHTFNALHEASKQIVISSDRPPKEIPTLEHRLRSRFEWGLLTDIQPPDLETRIAILRKKAKLETLNLPNDVIAYIATKIDTNIRELEGALIRIIAYSSLTNSEITLDLAAEAMKDILAPAKPRQLSIELIQQVVAEYFNLTVADFRAKRRTRSVAGPRQIAMYLSRELTGASLPKIGEQFGGRDHTTVIHACEKIAQDLKDDPTLSATLDELLARLKTAPGT